MQETYTIGPRTFVLDRAKAQEEFAAALRQLRHEQ